MRTWSLIFHRFCGTLAGDYTHLRRRCAEWERDAFPSQSREQYDSPTTFSNLLDVNELNRVTLTFLHCIRITVNKSFCRRSFFNICK